MSNSQVGRFPSTRLRRVRRTAALRRLVAETSLSPDDLVWPVFVTDGACMTSASCVNPSLTYMALTARAADFAVAELNRRNL